MSNQPDNSKEKQKRKKYAVFAVMVLAFAACMWFIFAPSGADKEKQQQGVGYNKEIPDPTNNDMIGDKRDAYEQASLKERQSKDVLSLQDYSSMLGNSTDSGDQIDLITEETEPLRQKEDRSAIRNSVSSYQDINKTLGTFYEKQKEDPEKEELREKMAELETRLREKDDRQSAMNEQVALMEKSYELAAKYMPQGQTYGDIQYPNEGSFADEGTSGMGAEAMKNKIVKSSAKNANEKVKITPVRQVQDRMVSALKQNYSNDNLLFLYDQPRNLGFNTLKATEKPIERNTIKAGIHGDQTVMSGQSVFLRLLEPIQVDNATIPANTILTGQANLQGERLDILISSIEYEGAIYPVKITTYDTDGTKGVYIPASMELDALKEMAANMGNSMGSSFTMTQSAGSQIASDLTKGTIQGMSQYFAKKIRMVKINLKSGHKILLYPEKQ